MIETNKILLADCMDIMAQMPDKYIDLALVDPPYVSKYGKSETQKNTLL